MEEILKSLHLLDSGGRSTESQLRNLCDYGSLGISKSLYKKAAVQFPPFWPNKPHFLCLSSKGITVLVSLYFLFNFLRFIPQLPPHTHTLFFLMYTIFGIWSKNTEQRGLITSLSLLALLQTAVKPSLLPGLLLAHTHFTVLQHTQVPSAELFPWGYSFLSIRLGHPPSICLMNI